MKEKKGGILNRRMVKKKRHALAVMSSPTRLRKLPPTSQYYRGG